MANFSQADLERMGLKDNGDGTYSKPKTVLQPREVKPVSIIEAMTSLDKEYNDTMIKIQKAIINTPKPKKVKVKEPTYWKGMSIVDVYAHATENNYIFISKNVPSLKNSKQIFKNNKTGKNFITSSDLCKQYIIDTETNWQIFKPKFLKMIEGKEKPYRIQFFFIRDKHKAFDYNNISQICLDCMTGNAYYPKTKDKLVNAQRTIQRKRMSWIEDDDCFNVIPNYDTGFAYDPNIAGVIIRVL